MEGECQEESAISDQLLGFSKARVERTLLSAAFDFACDHPRRQIPGKAVPPSFALFAKQPALSLPKGEGPYTARS